MIGKFKVGAIVQCTASDLYPSSINPEDYCIRVCKNTKLFDTVILAVPDVEESKVFKTLAKKWAVNLVKGSNYNVADRMLKASEAYKVDIIVRILLRRFYLDVELVSSMIELLLKEDADYVCLPTDYNYELAADVFVREALYRAINLLNGDNFETAFRQFAPWRLMEEDKINFKTVVHPGSDLYPKSKVKSIKNKLSKLLAENQVAYGFAFPASAYAFIQKFIKSDDVVLDIACGQGEGSRRLIEQCAEVVGVDYDTGYICNANKKYSNIDNLIYICEDALKFEQLETFDVITSMHTLEHLQDPQRFLILCKKNLKPKGKLFLEVPLLLPRPLGEPLYPFHTKEFTIEEIEKLLQNAGFKINKRFGRNRGVYTCIEAAREAVQYHCSRF